MTRSVTDAVTAADLYLDAPFPAGIELNASIWTRMSIRFDGYPTWTTTPSSSEAPPRTRQGGWLPDQYAAPVRLAGLFTSMITIRCGFAHAMVRREQHRNRRPLPQRLHCCRGLVVRPSQGRPVLRCHAEARRAAGPDVQGHIVTVTAVSNGTTAPRWGVGHGPSSASGMTATSSRRR
jgi:hypothetical protein